ncbi:hypothetical protein EN788_62530 [Mesorhizobium sp. M2D.F.Ca.ET.145.01.1.1]|nr:hypothetical protein EN788_62530 [Mesorhizobium sp. M2D.F.Ca.ET.145.01.1.1]
MTVRRRNLQKSTIHSTTRPISILIFSVIGRRRFVIKPLASHLHSRPWSSRLGIPSALSPRT